MMARGGYRSQELVDYLKEKIGPGRAYPSARALSLAAGLNPNAVLNLMERGRAEPETLLVLAQHMGVPVTRMFIMAGWLTEEDLASPPPLTEEQRQWVELAESLEPQQQELLRRVAEEFRGPTNQK